MSKVEQHPHRAIQRLNRAGFAVVVLLVCAVGAWAATSQLQGAVIAQGALVVESNIKNVQHLSGGIVGEILVKEGSPVEAGEIVMRLDDTVPRATLAVVQSQLDELTVREARLLAERDGAETVKFPVELVSRSQEKAVANAIAGEEKLFESRKQTRAGQRAQLRERIVQTREEISGLIVQQEAKEKEIGFISEELIGVTKLYKDNLVNIQRYMALQRNQALLQGQRGQLIASIGRLQARISETELQILQVDQDFGSEVLGDLRDAQGKIAQLRERKTGAEDELKRIDIRAPKAGIVHQLAVHTVGGVIAKGETVMQIVPASDKLLVEAKVAPQDIDQVALKAMTIVHIMAGNQRTVRDIFGEVTHIGADLTREKEQLYYLVRASIPEDQVQRLERLKLVPGMPAEVFIQTHARTPVEYLLKPLREHISRAFRER